MTNKTKKSFDFEGRQFVIEPPANITFKNGFYERVYRDLFAKLRDGECKPHIDCDDFTYQNAGFDYYQLGLNEGVALKKTSEKTSNNCSISDDLGKLLKEGRIGHRLSVNF